MSYSLLLTLINISFATAYVYFTTCDNCNHKNMLIIYVSYIAIFISFAAFLQQKGNWKWS